ncbi:MAG: deoxyguanosinetriphosphate triphosphohydrolase [Actinomycetes bacterium]
MTGYTAQDTDRWVPEPPKRPGRSDFQRDRARVLHSAGWRRLAGITQVVGAGEDDFVRNRLTHSLEVAQIARDLGQHVGADPDLAETAGLAHDLGHPPFGHNGERALDAWAAEIGGFEGNAQTLRVLTRLEAKTTVPGGRSVGLNLTRAALDATIKYPWPRPAAPGPAAPGPAAAGPPKFGVYDDDAEVFAWVRRSAPDDRVCVEAQVMDLADDVAYSVHDVEDAVASGRVRLEWLADPVERAELARLAVTTYLPGVRETVVLDALDRLVAEPYWPARLDGTRTAGAALKNLTSQLIGRFVRSVERATRDAHGAPPLRRYDADLVVPMPTRAEIAALKTVAARYVMAAEDRQPVLAAQRALVTELADAVWAHAPGTLTPVFAADWSTAAAGPDAPTACRRVVVDQVASLTDASVRVWARRLDVPAVDRASPAGTR